jgi:hypothetical protein
VATPESSSGALSIPVAQAVRHFPPEFATLDDQNDVILKVEGRSIEEYRNPKIANLPSRDTIECSKKQMKCRETVTPEPMKTGDMTAIVESGGFLFADQIKADASAIKSMEGAVTTDYTVSAWSKLGSGNYQIKAEMEYNACGKRTITIDSFEHTVSTSDAQSCDAYLPSEFQGFMLSGNFSIADAIQKSSSASGLPAPFSPEQSASNQQMQPSDSSGNAPTASPQGGPANDLAARDEASEFWIDPATGLMWTKKDFGSNLTWQQGMDYCQGLQLAGHSDWRLPTIDELESVYDTSVNIPGEACGTKATWHVKGNLQLSGWELSSSQGNTSGEVWEFIFFLRDHSHGVRYSNPLSNNSRNATSLNRALCVRRSEAAQNSPPSEAAPARTRSLEQPIINAASQIAANSATQSFRYSTQLAEVTNSNQTHLAPNAGQPRDGQIELEWKNPPAIPHP